MQSVTVLYVLKERGWIGDEKKEGKRSLRVPVLCQDTAPQKP